MSALPTVVPKGRRLAAGAAGLVGAIALAEEVSSDSVPAIALPIAGLAIAALIVHVPRLAPQLLARALWWSGVVLGLVLVLLGSGDERTTGMLQALGSGVALLVIGPKGLAEASEHGHYRPAAFGTTLQLLMVLALADSQMLVLMGLLDLNKGPGGGWVFLLAAAMLVVGFVGLYRLAIWGVCVNLLASAALGCVLLLDLVRVDERFSRPALALVLLQVVVPAPMLISLVTRRPLPSPSRRVRSFAASAVIVTSMLVAVGGTVIR